MNTGIVSSRYAKAFLRYTEETGGSERVCLQVRQILRHPDCVPSALEPEIARLVEILVRNGRLDDLRFILRSFIAQYYESRSIRIARLVSAVPAPGLSERLAAVLEKQFDCKVEIESAVDPDLMGGFVLEIGDYMLDASVKRQIDTIRRQFVINNNRIV